MGHFWSIFDHFSTKNCRFLIAFWSIFRHFSCFAKFTKKICYFSYVISTLFLIFRNFSYFFLIFRKFVVFFKFFDNFSFFLNFSKIFRFFKIFLCIFWKFVVFKIFLCIFLVFFIFSYFSLFFCFSCFFWIKHFFIVRSVYKRKRKRSSWSLGQALNLQNKLTRREIKGEGDPPTSMVFILLFHSFRSRHAKSTFNRSFPKNM